MRLRAREARPSVSFGGCCSATNEVVRIMKHRSYGALVASVGAVALLLAANEAFAGSGGASRAGFAPTHSSAHSASRPFVSRSFRHHRRNTVGAFWPGDGGIHYGPNGEPVMDAVPPAASNDVRYTSTYDVPWDWAHRFPPNVAPSDRPYVLSCPSESVTVPGRGGTEQTVNVMRCY
jgi:hypothetical protein